MDRTRRIRQLLDGTLVDEGAMVRVTTLRRLQEPCSRGPRCTVHRQRMTITETELRMLHGDR